MKTLETYDGLQVPGYALSYLFNGDCSGIEDEDIKAIDDWYAFYQAQAEELGGHIILSDDEDSEGYFCHNPAFGLACNVVDCTILILGN